MDSNPNEFNLFNYFDSKKNSYVNKELQLQLSLSEKKRK